MNTDEIKLLEMRKKEILEKQYLSTNDITSIVNVCTDICYNNKLQKECDIFCKNNLDKSMKSEKCEKELKNINNQIDILIKRDKYKKKLLSFSMIILALYIIWKYKNK